MPQVSRREAARQATRSEIVDAARRLLAEGGPASVSLRAVAGEVGMTAPGIYRYFASHDDLLLELTDLVVGELADEQERAAAEVPGDDPAGELLAGTRAFRRWCVAHPREFQLAFGLAPAPPGDALPPHCDTANVRRLCGFFFDLFVRLWQKYDFPVQQDESLDAALAEQLREFVRDREADVPVGLAKIYVDGWTRLYGAVAIEIFGHLRFAVTDVETLFETMLAEYVTTLLGGGTS